jgi:hypothetical protein
VDAIIKVLLARFLQIFEVGNYTTGRYMLTRKFARLLFNIWKIILQGKESGSGAKTRPQHEELLKYR